MIFGIKTRKELKKEIEELNTECARLKRMLDKAHFDMPMSKVNVVFDNRPIDTISAVLEVGEYAAKDIPENTIMDMLRSRLSWQLDKYIEIESCHDPMELVCRIRGTIRVVIPEGGMKNGRL